MEESPLIYIYSGIFEKPKRWISLNILFITNKCKFDVEVEVIKAEWEYKLLEKLFIKYLEKEMQT